MVYVTFFLTMTLLVYALMGMRQEKRSRIQSRLNRLYSEDTQNQQEVEETKDKENKRSFLRVIFKSIIRMARLGFRRSMHSDKIAKLELKLLQAGSPFGWTPVDFRILQITSLLALPIIAIGYSLLGRFSMGVTVLLFFIALIIGSVLPHVYLKQKTKSRVHTSIKELPDILDLLTVSLEAGLGFDGALSKVVSKKEGVLPSEFHRCIEEIRLGKTRREALLGIKQRLLADEVSVLISNIIQAEKLGIGMVQVLRIQSQEVRERRKQRAEEAAMKAPVKMLFPLVLFIFPSLFIVLLGPAVIQFMATFSSNP